MKIEKKIDILKKKINLLREQNKIYEKRFKRIQDILEGRK